jgi:large subunit ribosomal protein L29
MDAKELRSKSNQELRDELTALYKEQFNLRMQRAIGQAARPNQFSIVRKNIARVQTILSEKRIKASANVGE